MAITTNLDKVRLEIGDTEATSYLLSDDEINYFLTEESQNVLRAAFRACDALARKFARAYDFETDGQKFHRSQAFEAFSKAADALRKRAGISEFGNTNSGAGTIKTTRIDGYSDGDQPTNEDVLTTSSNPRRRYYGQEDRTP
jgi:hypothetical protein